MTTVKTSRKPKHLKACLSCGAKRPRWQAIGRQAFPARYAKALSMAGRLRDGSYT